MVVRVLDACDDECSGCCSSTTCSTNTTSYSTSSSTTNRFGDSASSCTTNAGPSAASSTLPPTNFRISCKNLVGNFKEFRIENNKSDLHFIGNGNRIKIINNHGNLNIIGNNTRLKITHNSGHVKYIGNDGRIYLGSDSTQQMVDYTGCNGILKVINATDLNASCKTTQQKDKSNTSDSKKTHASNSFKTKSASYDDIDQCKSAHWQNFTDFFQRQSTKSPSCSLPDLVQRCCLCGCKCKNSIVQMKSLNKNIKVSNNHGKASNISVEQRKIGSVVIKNRMEVRI